MYKASILSILLLLLLSLSCKKDNDFDITGKWILKKHFVDPGNGMGTWQDPWDEFINIQFNADGSLVSDMSWYDKFNRYAITNDTITFFRPNYPPVKRAYELSGPYLIIRPSCPERCDHMLERSR